MAEQLTNTEDTLIDGVFADEREKELLFAVDAAIVRAGEIMEMADLPEGTTEDEYEAYYEQRFHCGKCIVSTVMETIWDDMKNLIDYYEAKEPPKGPKPFISNDF